MTKPKAGWTPEQEAERRRRYATPERRAAYNEQRRRRRMTPEGRAVYAETERRRRYGLEPAIFDVMLTAQDGRCAVCSVLMAPPHVDHCHETGQIRGLLCGACNVAAGRLNDDPSRCHALGAYLERHAA